jgi:hypothetical protein
MRRGITVAHNGADEDKDHGRTRSGKLVTDELIVQLANEADAGFDVDENRLRRHG